MANPYGWGWQPLRSGKTGGRGKQGKDGKQGQRGKTGGRAAGVGS
eukprot:SAG22_NODE_865_length_6783_cov_23.880461_1_plen_45_part_00